MPSLYVKRDNSWVEVSNAYSKVNGLWVAQSDLSTLFDSRKKYLDGGNTNLIYEASNLVLTGSNYFDTGFMAYSSENFNKDFKITVLCANDVISTGDTSVVLGCKYEGTTGGKSYPGFYFRFGSGQYRNDLELSSSSSVRIRKPKGDFLGKTVYMSRRGGKWYLQIEDGAEESITPNNATVFNQSLLIGAGMQTNGNIFRYTKGTIEYVKIEYI